jgi:hippurate hydrolase
MKPEQGLAADMRRRIVTTVPSDCQRIAADDAAQAAKPTGSQVANLHAQNSGNALVLYATLRARVASADRQSAIQQTALPTLRMVAFLILVSAFSVALMTGPMLRAADIAARINRAAAAEYPSLEKLYQDLHAHPELSFYEANTAQKVAAELKTLGLQVTTNVGGYGLVAVVRNGAGPTVLVRTDLDALPVNEQTDLPFASKVRTTNDLGVEVNVMHACGHDVHMTSLVGTARALSKLKDHWSGTVVFIGQPAEERGAGARAMLADGLFTRFPKPDFCLALHVNSEQPAGTVALVEGFAMANVDALNITVRGAGGHGAWPHKTKDPVVLAAQIILALQTIVSRETDPLDSAVVTVGSIHGGTKHNIIPDEVKLQLTVRSFTDEVRERTLSAIRRIVRGQAIAAGIPEDRLPVVTVESGESIPATYNSPELTRRLRPALQHLLGDKNVITRRPSMGGEDFSEYGRTPDKIPICMFWLGSIEPERVSESERSGQPLPSLHSSQYRPVAEPTLKTGVSAMTAAVIELLRPAQ